MVFSMSVTLFCMFIYKDVLERLRKSVIRMRPDIADKWMLHHDNTHVTLPSTLQNFLPQKAFLWFPSPPIHLTSTPVTFYVFLNLKSSQRMSFRDFRKYPKERNGYAEDHSG